MKTNKLLSMFCILIGMATNASAYDIEVENADGVMIYYNYINNHTEAQVTFNIIDADNYSGSVVIPEEITYDNKTLKVTSIGKMAFCGSISLTSVTIPNSVTNIGEIAFERCRSLTSVNIPNGVTSIEKGAFWYCTGLTSVTIPKSLTSIGEFAFSDCTSLTSVNIPNSVTSIGKRAFIRCTSLDSVTIPNSVTSIGECVFYGCASLSSITIPNSVTSIEDAAFERCSGLTSITIPNSVTSIGMRAFCNCTSLVAFTIPNSVTSIGELAFHGCANLKTITSQIEKPFAIPAHAFSFYDSVYADVTLYVPTGTVAAYQATDGWKKFGNIVEEGTTTGIDDIEADNTLNTSNSIYDINGKRLPATSLDELPSGLYIVNGKKVVK